MTAPLTIVDVEAVTPLGQCWSETWDALLRGKRAFSTPAQAGIDLEADVLVAAVDGLKRSERADGRGPASRLMTAAIDRLLIPSDCEPNCWGASNHGETFAEAYSAVSEEAGRTELLRSHLFGTRNCGWVASACASGLHALFFPWLEAKRGPGSWMVVAGDALSSIGVAGFLSAGATGASAPEPLREGSRGMVVGEGAVAIFASSCEASDGPRLLAMSTTSDAGHPTHPDPEGKFLELALRNALRGAGLSPDDIGAVVGHGTGTEANDVVEAEVIGRIWPNGRVPVTSTKGCTGHLMGASGLLNVAVATEIWRTGNVPPVPGDGAPRRGLNVADGVTRVTAGKPVMAVASGFGGNNVAAVIG